MTDPWPATRRVEREIVDLYRDARFGTRVHIFGRLMSCPFAKLEREVPAAGRILDLGCGHGALAFFLACTKPSREVTGVDIDERKLAAARGAARRAASRGLDVTFDGVLRDAIPAGPWRAILVVDVLYLLEARQRRALLSECVSQLEPGGTLVVKGMAATPRWKAWVNRLQESLAVRVLGMSVGTALGLDSDEAPIRWMTDALDQVRVRRIDGGYPHPHLLATGLRPSSVGAAMEPR